MPKRRSVVFLHVQKTDATVRERLRAWFPNLRHVQFTSPEICGEMPDQEITQYDVFTGHIAFRFVSRVPNAILIISWRDPLERAISQFSYHKNNLHSFEDDDVMFSEYLKSDRPGLRGVLDDGIVWQFAWDHYPQHRDVARFPDATALYETGLNNIQKSHFVELPESLDQDPLILGKLLGVAQAQAGPRRANASVAKPSKTPLNVESRAAFNKRSVLDIWFANALRMWLRVVQR